MWLKILILVVTINLGLASDIKVITTSIAVNNLTNFVVSNQQEYIIKIDKLTFKIQETPPRVGVSCLECVEQHPVLVVVRQNKGVLSWELPLDVYAPKLYNKTAYLSTSRTLCPFDIVDKPIVGNEVENDVTISLSTSSPIALNVSLLITVEKQFILSLGEENKIIEYINPGTPRYYAYHFAQNDTESVLVHVTSDNNLCMTVSVKDMHCPVFDLERNVQFDGFWQSVTGSGSITVPRDAFRYGFYTVLVVREHDEDCKNEIFLQSVENRTKKVEIKILPTITIEEFEIAVAASLVALAAFGVIFFIIALYYMRSLQEIYPPVQSIDESTSSAIANIRKIVQNNATGQNSALLENDVELIAELEEDENFWRTRSVLYVCDLSRKRTDYLQTKSQMYLWYLLTVSIFYFLPVVQLVITYEKVLQSTGNQNLCFYNFQCAYPYHLLSDFNHVYSNIGYLILGGLFIVLVRKRQNLHRAAVVSNKAVDKCLGIPQHFGLFYAMGASLAVEGVLSGCYHVCPNQHNFQFDTSFMYVISTMCMLKIYHSRHPDVSAGACATFGVLAFTILLGMCGVLYGTPPFWSIFTLVHLTTCFILGIQIYYLGRWRLSWFGRLYIWKEFVDRIKTRNFRAVLPTYKSRFIVIFLAIAVNFSLAIIGPMYILGNFASYLLMIFMVNLMLYTTFYIIMKIVSKERIKRLPLIFIILACLTWACSFYFYINKAVSWRVSPAESRTQNRPCAILNFYDNHDIWHFLSAASMFFSFMVLLTLDDDLLNVPRNQIAVF